MTVSKGYLQKVKDTPLDIIIKKVTKRVYLKAYHKQRESRVRWNLIKIDNDPFMNWSSNIAPTFYRGKIRYYNDFLNNTNAGKETIKAADKICDHIFDLLGSGEVYLGKEINWNKDFKTGFIWENNYYNKIKTVDLSNNADVKVPWELSRFQHIPTLGQAFWLTGDKKYAEEFKKQIFSWLESNPFEMSVNWTCAMDVAIRACNWIIGIFYFKNSTNLESKFWNSINKSLYMHGLYIFNNLEKGEVNNNHYISDLVGLVWLGLYFSNIKMKKSKASKWLRFGIMELEKEMSKQVYHDGFNYEASTAYHCLVTEMLLYTTILCDRNKVYFSKTFKDKLEKMCVVLMNIIKPNGLIPQIGDTDSGRFIIFTGYGNKELLDFNYLLGVSGEYFHREDFRFYASNQLAALWLCDEILKIPNKVNNLESINFPRGGIHIIRNDSLYLLIRCGEIGTAGRGGHTHNDQLSIELNIGGEDFIIDPGTYVYTSDYKMRNKFRSTSYHNTLQVENLEQNNFGDNLFMIENQSRAKAHQYGHDFFIGEHSGFIHNKNTIKHRREVTVPTPNDIRIIDKVEQSEGLISHVRFIFSPEISVSIKGDDVILNGHKTTVVMKFTNANEVTISDIHYSKSYGVIEDTKSIVVKTNSNKIITDLSIKEGII